MKIALLLLGIATFVSAQRITTIQLDGVQYFVSRMNPYSPELNYFLAYQYCRSLGLQLASFETKEKADTMTQYLKNAGYTKYDFWTSGNKLGTDMFLWMSTGLPFNATFDYMLKRPGNRPADVPPGTEPQRVARESGDSGSADGCVAMMAPTLHWEAQDCTLIKDFICEQTRCYYYNYGSIPVSATQGNRRPYLTTTTAPASEEDQQEEISETGSEQDTSIPAGRATSSEESEVSSADRSSAEDPIVTRLVTSAASSSMKHYSTTSSSASSADKVRHQPSDVELDAARPEHIPDIASLFTDNPASQPRKDNVFEGLETHEVLRTGSSRATSLNMRAEHRESPDYDAVAETELPDNALEDAHTIGPYDSVQDYVNDQAEPAGSPVVKEQDDDSSTILPEAEPAYRYNIKVRSNGKVLDPPSK
ncbi:uncharacterized protein [Prorops nasuta]|uniref:uncharacterized protein n=1 Tax=Prorops nasuta TaxID=863751 RepID=UPI0034CF19A1